MQAEERPEADFRGWVVQASQEGGDPALTFARVTRRLIGEMLSRFASHSRRLRLVLVDGEQCCGGRGLADCAKAIDGTVALIFLWRFASQTNYLADSGGRPPFHGIGGGHPPFLRVVTMQCVEDFLGVGHQYSIRSNIDVQSRRGPPPSRASPRFAGIERAAGASGT